MDPSAKPEAPPWWGFTQALLVGSCLLIVGLALLLKSSDWPSFMVAGRLASAQPDRLYDRDAERRDLAGVAGLAGRSRAPGIIGHEFGSR